MSDKITNTQDRPEEKPLTEQELQFCNLYVNGGLEYAGRPKKCFVEVFGEDTVKNPYASANYLMNKPHVLAHIKALLSSERFEMETMAVKLQVTETLKAIKDETATSDYTDRFGVPLSPAPLRAVSVNARQGADGYLPHQAQGGEPPAYRRQRRQCYLQCNRTPKSCKRWQKRKRKITKEEIAWWVYLAMMIALVIYGFRDSAAAETLLRAIRDAFSLLME